MKRWPFILLIVSLIANVFLIGVVAGSVWRWTHDQGIGLRGGWRARAAGALPQPQSDAFRESVHQIVQASLPEIRAGRAERAEARRLFVQPQLDAAAANAALDRARAADVAVRTRIEHQVVTFATTLSQNERRRLADALKAGPLREGRQR